MAKIHMITDSASDIAVEDEKSLNIRVLPFMVSLGEKSVLSRVDVDNEQFFALMNEYPNEIPKTSQITPYEFEEIYMEEYKAGYSDIVLVLINSKGSATYSNAVMSVDTFYEEHPECKDTFHIHVFDGIGYTGLYGYPVVEAAKMIEAGKDIADITAYLSDVLPKRCIYFGITELKYAGKSGRIPTAAALVGDKLNIKPVMKIFDNEITTAVKCRGENKLMAKIIEETVKDMAPGSEYQIAYGSDSKMRDVLTEKMIEAVGYPPTCAFQIGAVIAANSGPRVAGTIFEIKGK